AATPGVLGAAYQAAADAARAAGAEARGHASRFDAAGAVLFMTLTVDGAPVAADHPARAAALRAADTAGAYLLGATNPVLIPYFVALRDALDPGRVLNPGVLED